MPKLSDADVAKIANKMKDTLRLFAIAGNSTQTLIRISSGDVIAVRIFNATRADTITGGIAKKKVKRGSKKEATGG